MTFSYHLKKDNSDIHIAVKVGTIGIASTVVSKKRSGGSFEVIAVSKTATGNISKKKIGASIELIGSTIVSDLIIFLQGVPKNQLDQAFENLFFRVTLTGGLDGDQFFDVAAGDKIQHADKRFIGASIAVKLITTNV